MAGQIQRGIESISTVPIKENTLTFGGLHFIAYDFFTKINAHLILVKN